MNIGKVNIPMQTRAILDNINRAKLDRVNHEMNGPKNGYVADLRYCKIPNKLVDKVFVSENVIIRDARIDDISTLREKVQVVENCVFTQKITPSNITTGITFINCDLSGIKFKDSFFSSCIFDRCNLEGSKFYGMGFLSCKAIESDLSNTLFKCLGLDINYENCRIKNITVDQSLIN